MPTTRETFAIVFRASRAGALSIGLALGSAGAAIAGVDVSPPTELAFVTNGDAFGISAAVLDDGSFAIGDSELMRFDEEHFGVRFVVQFFGPDGNPLGSPVVVAGFDSQGVGGIGSVGTRYFVNWAQAFDKGAYVTFAAFYDRVGTRECEPFSIPGSELVYPPYPSAYRYGRAPTSRILPVVIHKVGLDAGGSPLLQPTFQVFSSMARPLGPPFRVVSPRRQMDFYDVSINGRGRLAVASFQCPGRLHAHLPCVNGVQLFDGPGRVRSPLLRDGLPPYVDALDRFSGGLQVGLADQGWFLVTWVEDFYGEAKLLARLFNRRGRPFPEVQEVLPFDQGGTESDQVLTLSSGDFVLAWTVLNQDHTLQHAYLARYDAQRRALGPATELIAGQRLSNIPVVAMGPTGQGVAIWKAETDDGSVGYYRRFTVTDEAPAVAGGGAHER